MKTTKNLSMAQRHEFARGVLTSLGFTCDRLFPTETLTRFTTEVCKRHESGRG